MKNFADSLISVFLPWSGFIINASRILAMTAVGVELAVAAIPLALTALVYYPIRSYLSRSTDK